MPFFILNMSVRQFSAAACGGWRRLSVCRNPASAATSLRLEQYLVLQLFERGNNYSAAIWGSSAYLVQVRVSRPLFAPL